MERIGGVHAEWYRRHIAHLAYAMEALEEGDHGAACYHAYHAVSALLSGIIGLDPYASGAYVKTLSAMLKTTVDHPPADVATCGEFLDSQYFSGEDGEKCVACAERLIDALHELLLL
jgi:HEPN domain-containing protein